MTDEQLLDEITKIANRQCLSHGDGYANFHVIRNLIEKERQVGWRRRFTD